MSAQAAMRMLDALKPWMSRFDRMNLRERVGLAAAAAALLYFVLSTVIVGSDEAKSKALEQRIEAQNTGLASVRKEIVELTRLLERDPNAQEQAKLDGMKRAIAEADALLAQLESAAPQAGAALKEVLGVSPGLELVSLKTLPVTLAFQSKPAPAAGAKPPIPAPPPRSIYRHGIEIGIKGNYLTLLPYLEKLQKYPGRLYWTDVSLDVQSYPDAVLKLTVYTLSGQANPRLG